MSKVELINVSAAQKILDQIGAILALELTNQIALVKAKIAEVPPDLKDWELYLESIPKKDVNGTDTAVVYVNRDIEGSASEAPLLNVIFSRTQLDELKTQGTLSGPIKFTVETWQSKKTKGEDRGDQYSKYKALRLIMACVSILSDRAYHRLGFPTPGIGYVICSDVLMAHPQAGATSSENEIYTWFDVTVKAPEVIPDRVGENIAGSDTDLTLNDTEKGFAWTVNF